MNQTISSFTFLALDFFMKGEGAHTFLQEHKIIGGIANGYYPLKLALDVKLSVSALSTKGPGQVHKSSPTQPPIWALGAILQTVVFLSSPHLCYVAVTFFPQMPQATHQLL